MSIQSQITRIKTKVDETFTVLQDKGVIDASTERKLDNLPTIIQDSEIGGGGIGTDESTLQYIERTSTTINNNSLTKLGDFTGSNGDFTDLTFTKVKEIGRQCFYTNRSLTNINFPVLTTAGESAFDSCSSLTSVSLPKLTNAGSYLFRQCSSLSDVHFASLVIAGPYMFSDTQISAITEDNFPALTTIGDHAFQELTTLKKLTSTKIISIGESGVAGNRYIEELSLPNLQTLGDNAFSNVYNESSSSVHRTTYDFPNLVTIGAGAFRYNSDLQTITFPKVTSIGGEAFYNCTNLEYISLPLCTSVGTSCFSNNYKLKTLLLPALTTMDAQAFSSFYSVKKLELPAVTILTNGSEFYNSGFREILMPNVTNISSSAFSNNGYLLYAYYPKVTTIESQAFSSCTSLQKVWIPANATVSADDSYYYYYMFSNAPLVQIYTDATAKPDTWGTYFNRWNSDSSKLLTVHYGTTKEDFDAQKVVNAQFVCNDTSDYLTVNDGVVSNYSSSWYNLLNNNAYNSISDAEFVIKFTTPTEEPTDTQYLVFNAWYMGITLGSMSDNRLMLARYKWSSSSYEAITALELNTTYYLKMRVYGKKIHFFLSTDGETYNYILTSKDSNQNSWNDNMTLGTSADNTSNYWKGSIDFNGCFIKESDTTLWTGILGGTANSGTDVGYVNPTPEALDTDQLIAHWDFEKSWKDDIGNIEISKGEQGLLAVDESYRGNGSGIFTNSDYTSYYDRTNIKSLNLSFDNNWSIAFRVHSDYFKQDESSAYMYSMYVGLINAKPVSTSSWDSMYQYYLCVYDAGYRGANVYYGNNSKTLDTTTIRNFLIDDWNKYVIQYNASKHTITIYLNGNLIDTIENVQNSNGTDYNTFPYMYFSTYSQNNGQYIDDLCIYNKLLIAENTDSGNTGGDTGDTGATTNPVTYVDGTLTIPLGTYTETTGDKRAVTTENIWTMSVDQTGYLYLNATSGVPELYTELTGTETKTAIYLGDIVSSGKVGYVWEPNENISYKPAVMHAYMWTDSTNDITVYTDSQKVAKKDEVYSSPYADATVLGYISKAGTKTAYYGATSYDLTNEITYKGSL